VSGPAGSETSVVSPEEPRLPENSTPAEPEADRTTTSTREQGRLLSSASPTDWATAVRELSLATAAATFGKYSSAKVSRTAGPTVDSASTSDGTATGVTSDGVCSTTAASRSPSPTGASSAFTLPKRTTVPDERTAVVWISHPSTVVPLVEPRSVTDTEPSTTTSRA
jgi:hypothetical protein